MPFSISIVATSTLLSILGTDSNSFSNCSSNLSNVALSSVSKDSFNGLLFSFFNSEACSNN